MGAKLLQCYEFAKQCGGVLFQMRLAMKTGLPSNRASSEPDSSENIEKFKKAIKEITGKDAPVS